jgi:hypothetical protein
MLVQHSLHEASNPVFEGNSDLLGLQTRVAVAHNLKRKCFGKSGDKPGNPDTRFKQATNREELTT